MALIDAVVHPQAVFVNWDPAQPGLLAMQSMVAGSIMLESNEELGERRELDLDLWVNRGDTIVGVPEHMHVLSFSALNPGWVRTSNGSTTVSYTATNPSPTMRVADGLVAEVEDLVRNELVPWLQGLERRPVLQRSAGFGPNRSRRPISSDDEFVAMMMPFVFDADDNVIAGAFQRPSREEDRDAWHWILPHAPERPELWLAAAMRDWHERTPTTIPVGLAWQHRESWATKAETDAHEALRLLQGRRERWEQLYAARRTELLAQQMHAQAEAAAGVRRLITSHDDDLVSATAQALTQMGFQVTDEDETRAREGRGKAHDLNVVDPDAPDRRVIVEVKGYTKGARGALSQANQHILRFATTHGGRVPDNCWLVVNHFRDHDPDERPPLLQGADEDVAIFAESGGVLIDTRTIFRMVRMVESGSLTAVAAREALRNASGRFALPGSVPNDT